MEQAFTIDPDLERRWPHAHYWYAMALCREARLPEALSIVEDRLERKADCPYLGQLANDILSKLWRMDPSYLTNAEEFFSLRIDPRQPDYQALVEMLDILQSTDRVSDAWEMLDQFLEVGELSVRRIAERIPLTISDLSAAFVSIDYYRRFRESSPLSNYARILNEFKAQPHKDVPNALFHLLMPSYCKIATALQDSDLSPEAENETHLETYKLVSRTFAAFGGLLISPTVPLDVETQTRLIAGAIIFGQDVPLMEISRLLGYLSGVSGRPLSEGYQTAIVESSPAVHETWLTEFLKAVGSDWQIEAWSD